MTAAGWAEFGTLALLIAVSTPLLGRYLYRVHFDTRAPGDRVFLPIERAMYRVCGIDPAGEQRWTTYTFSLLAFSFVSCVLSYGLLRLQGALPLNPDGFSGVPAGLSWNTAVSFLTGTNWQSYAGESTMSHLSQMVALTVHQFLAGAVGIAVAVALIREMARRRQATLGSFWVDLVRGLTRVLLPLSFVFALVLVSQGVIQNFEGRHDVATVAVQQVDDGGQAVRTQSVPGGPVASMVPIELAGSNGGGFYNANIAHPFQNPNPLSTVLLYWLVFAIPFALPYTFGKAVGSRKQGWVVLAATTILLTATTVLGYVFEAGGNPALDTAGVSQEATATQPGGNLEGKDVRIGVSGAILGSASTATTAGAPDAAFESFVPLTGDTPSPTCWSARSARRGRQWAVRDGDLRPHQCVHRRADGRANTGVPRQEDPGRRDEARRAVHPRGPRRHARVRGRRCGVQVGGGPTSRSPAHTG